MARTMEKDGCSVPTPRLPLVPEKVLRVGRTIQELCIALDIRHLSLKALPLLCPLLAFQSHLILSRTKHSAICSLCILCTPPLLPSFSSPTPYFSALGSQREGVACRNGVWLGRATPSPLLSTFIQGPCYPSNTPSSVPDLTFASGYREDQTYADSLDWVLPRFGGCDRCAMSFLRISQMDFRRACTPRMAALIFLQPK